MKPGWMKSWLCVSAIVAMVATAVSALPQNPKPVMRKNELSLYGIRPGKDNLLAVKKRIGEMILLPAEKIPNGWVWHDLCNGLELKVELDKREVVEAIHIGRGAAIDDCRGRTNTNLWATGRGLRIHDKLQRAIEIYGEPNSRGPSVRNGQELELLYYAFDWAGSDVPQVMEVSCDKATGRVVEIMLAFPSL